MNYTPITGNFEWRDFFAVPIHQAPAAWVGAVAVTESLVAAALPALWTAGRCWAAGGVLRDVVAGAPRKDVDLFFETKTDLADARGELLAKGWIETQESGAAYQLRGPDGLVFDLVRRQRMSPMETVMRFDFVSCCVAVSNEHLVFHRAAAEQAAARELRFNACPAPRSSVARALRLIARGWSIQPADAAWLIEQGRTRPFDVESACSSAPEDEQAQDDEFFETQAAELRRAVGVEPEVALMATS